MQHSPNNQDIYLKQKITKQTAHRKRVNPSPQQKYIA